MARADERLAALAKEIGPRPACEEGEREAGDYIREILDAKDLSVEQQRIRSPKTYSYTYLIYFAVAIGVAALSYWYPGWAALAGVLTAVAFWFELDTREIVSRLMPHGQSRNIIGRLHASGSGAATVVVLVAHYDSARAALPFSPRLVRSFRTTFILTAGSVWAISLLAVVRWGVLFASPVPYVWYAMLVPAVYLLFPIGMYLHRELAMPWVDGANDNASGVVAMLEVMERLTANRTRPRRIDVDEAREGSGPSDETTTGVATESSVRPGVADEGDWSEGIDFGPPSRGPALPGYRTGSGGDDSEDDWASAADGDELDGQEALFTPGPNEGEPRESAHEEGGSAHEDPEAGQASDRGGDPQEGPRAGAPGGDWGDVTFTDWLGVDQHWDVHQEGKRIADLPGLEEGLADAQATLAEPESPEQTVFEQLAGPAPEAGIETREAPDLAFERPERPPRPDSVPGRTEAGLANKEVWFVATGCEEAGTFGMIEFLKRYGTRLRDAYFINLDNLGSGRLVFVSDEGLMRTHGADPRLLAASRQVADLKNFDIVAHPYHLLTTDATALMARRHRAMSVMALDDRGMLPNWHWMTDTVDRVRVENVESAADFVFELIKNL